MRPPRRLIPQGSFTQESDFFDDIKDLVYHLKVHAKFSLDLSLYLINSKKLVNRIVKLHLHAVRIRIILDTRQAKVCSSYVRKLKKKGVPIRWKPSDRDVLNKICLVNTINDERVEANDSMVFALAGVFDPTVSDINESIQNVMLSTSKFVIRYYQKEFEQLWASLEDDSD